MAKIKFGKYEFEGPYPNISHIYDRPAVYLILTSDVREESKFYVVDVDESETPRSQIQNHPRKTDWVKNAHGTGYLNIAIMYAMAMTKEERQKAVKYIRGIYTVPCGNG